VLELQGDGFKLKMNYNTRLVSPKIEFYEVTDNGLRRYWPDGITRIVLELKNPKVKGRNSVTLTR
jgi:hypothetical protein